MPPPCPPPLAPSAPSGSLPPRRPLPPVGKHPSELAPGILFLNLCDRLGHLGSPEVTKLLFSLLQAGAPVVYRSQKWAPSTSPTTDMQLYPALRAALADPHGPAALLSAAQFVCGRQWSKLGKKKFKFTGPVADALAKYDPPRAAHQLEKDQTMALSTVTTTFSLKAMDLLIRDRESQFHTRYIAALAELRGIAPTATLAVAASLALPAVTQDQLLLLHSVTNVWAQVSKPFFTSRATDDPQRATSKPVLPLLHGVPSDSVFQSPSLDPLRLISTTWACLHYVFINCPEFTLGINAAPANDLVQVRIKAIRTKELYKPHDEMIDTFFSSFPSNFVSAMHYIYHNVTAITELANEFTSLMSQPHRPSADVMQLIGDLSSPVLKPLKDHMPHQLHDPLIQEAYGRRFLPTYRSLLLPDSIQKKKVFRNELLFMDSSKSKAANQALEHVLNEAGQYLTQSRNSPHDPYFPLLLHAASDQDGFLLKGGYLACDQLHPVAISRVLSHNSQRYTTEVLRSCHERQLLMERSSPPGYSLAASATPNTALTPPLPVGPLPPASPISSHS